MDADLWQGKYYEMKFSFLVSRLVDVAVPHAAPWLPFMLPTRMNDRTIRLFFVDIE